MNKASLLKAVKYTVYFLVVASIGYTLWKGYHEIQESPISISNFRWEWLPLVCLFYFASISFCSIYWHLVLKALDQNPDFKESFRAFMLGQLGKYFPGKALVVIIRSSVISGPKVQTAVAATSVFVETLTYMAVGAGVAFVFMIFFFDIGPWLIAISVAAVLLAGLPIFPPVLRKLVRFFHLHKLSPKIREAVDNMKTRTAVLGWIMLPFSWLLVGLSLWALIQLIGITDVPITELPRITACAAMAIVVGFLSMMPGGLGAREVVLAALLNPVNPVFDSPTTIFLAVVLRLSWLGTEMIAAGIIKLSGFAAKKKLAVGS